MFIILKESDTVEPVFYSEGLYQAKRDLQSHVKDEYDVAKVFAFNYDLKEFDSNQTVLRFGDENERSIQVIRIEMVEQYGVSYLMGYETEQQSTIESVYRLYEVNRLKADRVCDPIPEPMPVPRIFERPSHASSFDPMDQMMQELLRRTRRDDEEFTCMDDSWSDF